VSHDPTTDPRAGGEPVEYLVERVRETIATDADAHELGVGVQAAGGRLLLTGTTASDDQRRAIGELANQVAPDFDVINDVDVATVAPPDTVEHL
jgi:osmotically-inducible protein OsmY